MNLADLREHARDRLGLPVAGEKGTATFGRMVRRAVQKLGADIPSILLRSTYQFQLEVPFTAGTADPSPSDHFVITDLSVTITTHTIDKELMRGRWIEIRRSNESIWHQYRVRDVIAPTLGSAGLSIILDKPWPTNSDVDLAYRIYTKEYPVPADLRDLYDVVISAETSPCRIQRALDHTALTRLRLARGWSNTGVPTCYGIGDWKQLEGPRQAPVAALDDAKAWGYPSGVEDVNCGPPGKFRYFYCLVWGRKPHPEMLSPTGTSTSTFPGASSVRAPFYISGASTGSAHVTVAGWNTAGVKLTSPDMDYVFGFNADPSATSHHHSGLEKWWFRQRVTVGTPGGSVHPNIEADSVPYLWRITPAYETETWDLGDSDPPNRMYPLQDWTGQRSVLFDIPPSAAENVTVSYIPRPPEILNENDALPLPPEALDPLFILIQLYRLGDLENDAAARQELQRSYKLALESLRKLVIPGVRGQAFGNGLGGWETLPVPAPTFTSVQSV